MKITRPTLALGAAAMIVAGLGTAPAFASGPDRNCDDFTSLEELTTYVEANPGDPSGLDADDDGIACEGAFPPGATLVDAAPGEENTDEGSGDTAENSDENSNDDNDNDNDNDNDETMQGGGAMPSGGVQTGEAAVASDAPLVAGGAAVLAGAGLLVLARRRAED